eukprot:TRINITY_DN2870_c0_g2_i1.p1 TRINITY_DN2870_c0_g2~~TRINITY_DN2870_c0_g2_i1.p1  ORF type:complete len:431 (+),score=58.70 TRINITY_DN2870_c0_g2_i1:607-1899(+)
MGLAEHCSLDGHCSRWAFVVLRDCVCSSREDLSLFLGLASIFCWGVAEIPQIIANWRLGNAEGVSLAFILTWTVGDLFNLAGCLVEPVTLPTQFYTSVLYTITTLALVLQNLWFSNRREISSTNEQGTTESLHQEEDSAQRVHGWEAGAALEGLFPSDPTLADGTKIPGMAVAPQNGRGRSSSHAASVPSSSQSPTSFSYVGGGSWRRLTLSTSYSTSPRLRALLVLAFVTSGMSFTTRFYPWADAGAAGSVLLPSSSLSGGLSSRASLGPWLVFPLQARRRLLQLPSPEGVALILSGPSIARMPLGGPDGGSGEELRELVGQILGWAMTCVYLTGRLPQIILNVSRGTVEGLSWSTFAFAISGNAAYFASILVRSTEWDQLWPNLPWLVDSASCLGMDCLILGQCLYYSLQAYRKMQRQQVQYQILHGP